jgi:hypothetical protein
MERVAGFINGTDLEFKDISDETYRVYVFSDIEIRIENPLKLHVTFKKSGHSHRIYDAQGVSHYIPSGWKHLYWQVKEGQPNFVF